MWIAVLDLAARNQTANFNQLVDDRFVGIALFPIGFQNLRATEERQVRPERAIVQHVIGDDLIKHAQITVELVFLHPVAGRTVDEPGAFLIGHKLGGPEVAQIIPLATAALGTRQRVLQREA